MPKKQRTYAARLAHWSRKFTREAGVSFVPAVGLWACHLLEKLDRKSDRTVKAADMKSLADEVGIPRKFLSRVLGATNGLVSLHLGPPHRLVLHRKRLLRGKNVVDKTRAHISKSLRRQLLAKDDHRCGRCGKKFPPEELEIDHLVPLARRGADEPGNWVALCLSDHEKKRTRFQYGFIQYYRGEPVRGSVGVRFREGFFWPHVNGRTRMDRRSDWKSVT